MGYDYEWLLINEKAGGLINLSPRSVVINSEMDFIILSGRITFKRHNFYIGVMELNGSGNLISGSLIKFSH